ncbi:MAG: TonB-dependent receptor [Saprospiraceae bacterium]
MRSLLCVLFLLGYSLSFGQVSDTMDRITLPSIVVTAYKEKPLRETSINISTLKIDSLSNLGNFNLTDLMAKTPGISMLTTGVAIAKPVIRGLYGNRVLILLAGLKFDNQQWQEEHGLGLSDMGLSKVEIIKGPLSVLYGTEAIGGIINVIDEDKPEVNTSETDASIKFNTNTLGGLLQVGYKINHGKKWYRLRVGIENNADYSDGNSERVLNSRFKSYMLKSTYGFQKNRWTSTNNFMSSVNQFGFIFNDIYEFVKPDSRWSRDLSINPSHLVILNILSSENKFRLKDESILDLNLGFQSNGRLENEGGGAISLNMELLTFQYLLKWEKRLSEKNRLILSNLGSFEDNTNYGARKIVPDANMQESNVSAYLESTLSPTLIFENGIGGGEKWIKTFFTASVNGPDKEVKPFTKFSPYYNVFSGLTYFPNEKFNAKFSLVTGVRIGNLAELSSNGLHEGVFTYEIGNPNLKNEQNICGNLFLNYKSAAFDLSLSPFYNYFFNYIYLSPTTEDWFGFPVFRYKQQNATQYGTEFTFGVRPATDIRIGINYSGMISKTEDGNYSPFVPAQKLTPSIELTIHSRNIKNIHLYTNVDYYFDQNNIAPNEITTPHYTLWNAGASTAFEGTSNSFELSISGNNLLNTAYYDHLSRFKYFGLLNIGRNISFNAKVMFTKQVNHE